MSLELKPQAKRLKSGGDEYVLASKKKGNQRKT